MVWLYNAKRSGENVAFIWDIAGRFLFLSLSCRLTFGELRIVAIARSIQGQSAGGFPAVACRMSNLNCQHFGCWIFLSGLVFHESFRVLKKGKFMCVLIGDLIRKGKFVPLVRRASNLAEETGFADYGYAIKLAHGEISRRKSGVIVAEPVYADNLKISHDVVLFFKKPS